MLVASTPMWNSLWAWSDPGHRRVISNGTLSFLSQKMYAEGVGKGPMADYRSIWKGDLEVVDLKETADRFWFVLRANK